MRRGLRIPGAPIAARLAVRPIGWRRNGSPIWPIMGAAAPTVAGTPATTSDQTAATSHNLNLPTGITAGETLIMEVASKAPVNEAAISGWTRFIDVSLGTGSGASLHCFWKKADGTESGTVACTTTTSTRMAAICRRWTGASDPTVSAPEGGTVTQANTINPNPPSYTAGSAKDYEAVALFASSHGRTASAYPTSYADSQTTAGPNNGTATNIGMGSAGRALTAATTEDPGTFTTTGTGVEETASATYFIHPAGSPNATATPGVVVAIGGIPAPTAQGAAQPAPGSLAAIGAVPSAAIAASAVATPAAVAAVGAVPAPTIIAESPNAVATPGTVASVSAIPAPSVQATAQPIPGMVSAIGGVPAPAVAAAAVSSPSVTAAVAAVPAPTILVGGDGVAAPNTVAVVGAVPVPSVLAAGLVGPGVVAALAAVGVPSVVAGAIASPNVVAAVARVPSPTFPEAVVVYLSEGDSAVVGMDGNPAVVGWDGGGGAAVGVEGDP